MAGGNRPAPVSAVRLPTEKAKERFLELLGQGSKIDPALAAVGMSSRSTYERWRREDAAFKANADFIQARAKGAKKPVPDFETFSREYLGEELFWHQLQWIDLLEGREPRQLHPAQTFRPGRPTRLLINTPPNHAKSTTITQNYVVWRILRNPEISIVIVSKTETFAKDFIHGIKQRLTGADYTQLQIDFAPPEGFEAASDEWSATRVRLPSESGQKDPTVQVLGMGGQIYGKRAHLVILDDCVVLSNAHEYEKQARWIRQEVATRLHKGGRLLIVGTRVAHMDLYKFMRDDDGKNIYSYLSQPIILDHADGDPANWVTLWPRSNVPNSTDGEDEELPGPDGLFSRWDGPAVFDLREEASATAWALAYMQADVELNATFPERSVLASVNGQRAHGPLRRGAVGHPEQGMDGMYRICSMDPALTGSTAAIAMAVDKHNGRRFVLDVFNRAGMSPAGIHEHIRVWTDKYNPHEWRIEKNAMQGMITQDRALLDWLASRGVNMREHYTDARKWDAEFGVASMAPLFPTLDSEGQPMPGTGLIELPSARWNEHVNTLISQLISWAPTMQGAKAKPGSTDLVMALWFADVRARELVNKSGVLDFVKNRYLSRAGRASRYTIDIEAALAAQMEPEPEML